MVLHRTFFTFLLACHVPSPEVASANPALPRIAGVPDALERVAAFAGVLMGAELRRTRDAGAAIAAIDWASHDH